MLGFDDPIGCEPVPHQNARNGNLFAKYSSTACEHLVHSDPGSDRCMPQARLADRFLHATRAQLGNVTQDSDDALSSCAYLRGFTPFDSPNGFSGDVTPFANFVR